MARVHNINPPKTNMTMEKSPNCSIGDTSTHSWLAVFQPVAGGGVIGSSYLAEAAGGVPPHSNRVFFFSAEVKRKTKKTGENTQFFGA